MTRRCSIDLLRILSAAAVLIIHVVSAPVTYGGATVDTDLAANLKLIPILMRWSVPVFFMITGYCLLMKQECTYKYCFSHVMKFACILLTVGFFYALLEEVYSAATINPSVIIHSIRNVITGNLWDHMWYIYAIIGVYLVMPVVHHFMNKSARDAYTLTCLLFFFSVLCPFFEEWLPFGITLPFGGYLFYVCFGGLIAKYPLNRYITTICYIGGLLSFLWIIIGLGHFSFGYLSPAVCFIAMSIFMLISRREMKPHKTILALSKCTWGIYLIHPFFINIVIKVLKFDPLSSFPYVKLSLLAIVIFLFSFIATFLLRKIPVLKKLF